jgi:hypothetical protein
MVNLPGYMGADPTAPGGPDHHALYRFKGFRVEWQDYPFFLVKLWSPARLVLT